MTPSFSPQSSPPQDRMATTAVTSVPPNSRLDLETPTIGDPPTKSSADVLNYRLSSPAESAIATHFCTMPQKAKRNPNPVLFSPRAAANLYELFVHELSTLVAGACQTD